MASPHRPDHRCRRRAGQGVRARLRPPRLPRGGWRTWNDGAEETAELVLDTGADAAAFHADVTSLDSTIRGPRKACAEFGNGSIDVVLNNAAVYAGVTRSLFEDIDPAEWDLVMNVNLKGPWLVTRAASPYLPEGGRVINLSSAYNL